MTMADTTTTAAKVEAAAQDAASTAVHAADDAVDKAFDSAVGKAGEAIAKAVAPKDEDESAKAKDAPPKRPPRSPEEIKADLERARQSLLSNVDAIQAYVRPSNVLERSTRRFRRMYVSDTGAPNVKGIAITAAVVGIYVLYRIRK
jgi:hypothetical protein